MPFRAMEMIKQLNLDVKQSVLFLHDTHRNYTPRTTAISSIYRVCISDANSFNINQRVIPDSI